MVDWDHITNRFGPSVWKTAYRLLGNRADADDCFQETFLAALKLSRGRPVEHWGALLQRVATTRAIDRLRERGRRHARESPADFEPVDATGPRPPELAEASELSDRLRRALTQLPDRPAEVFCLHCLEGWTHQEIADHLAVSVDAVAVALHRARKQLHDLLAPAPRTIER
jgi:RNA polymerase sigma-70 factor (ECF subfamily)